MPIWPISREYQDSVSFDAEVAIAYGMFVGGRLSGQWSGQKLGALRPERRFRTESVLRTIASTL